VGFVPRRPRLQFPGGLYHVNTRGNRRCAIYLDDDDRTYFLRLLAKVVVRAKWTCHAYCLMTNHYHLLVETHEATISDGMEILNGQFARGFNAKYGLRGHLFEERFYDEVVEDDVQLLSAARYIVRNPVRAALCERAADWRWSSCAATAGAAQAPTFLTVDTLLGMFGRDRHAAARRYVEFVEDMAA
jgi:putative transposase